MRRSFKLRFAVVAAVIAAAAVSSSAQVRIGEKLSYTLSFGKFKDGGYAEMFVASKGRLGARDVIEIRSRVKTIGIVSASFMLLDEARTVYIDPATGVPVLIKRTLNEGALPRQLVSNYLTTPTSSFDLTSLIYKVRESGGTGTYTFLEGERVYTATFQVSGTERVATDAGEYDSSVVTVQSEFLVSHGLRDLKINLSSDEAKVPVMIRFKSSKKTEFRATLSAIAIDLPSAVAPDPTATPTQVPGATPIPIPTPRPTATPKPYVENEPLLSELGFSLGEKLTYRISSNDQGLATIVFEAVERKLFQERDSLLLSATVTGVDKQNALFRPGDQLRAQVDPDTLAPRWMEGKFGPGLASLNQTVTLDARGNITFGGAKPVDAPMGTHTLLSLFYAMRSFNLQHSRDNSNPINDTRVAVFWSDKPYIFTLRPSPPADITYNGQKVSAQLVTVNTGNPVLDSLVIKVWFATDTRVPLRITAGPYQADLIPNS